MDNKNTFEFPYYVNRVEKVIPGEAVFIAEYVSPIIIRRIRLAHYPSVVIINPPPFSIPGLHEFFFFGSLIIFLRNPKKTDKKENQDE